MIIRTLRPIFAKETTQLSKLVQFYIFILITINKLLFAFSTQITNNIYIDWFNTNFSALDVGVGSKGDVFVIGIDKNLYFYEFRMNHFILIQKDLKLKDKNFMRLDVDDSGNPFVVTEDSEIYFYSDKGKWVQIPGCARDIGIGKNQNLWKIGCNEELEGYGIWNLFCFNTHKNSINNEDINENLNNIKNNNSNKYEGDNYNYGSIKSVPSLIYEKLDQERKINHNKRHKYKVYHKDSTKVNFAINKQNELEENMNENYSNCFWLKSDAAGMRIDVGENGNPVIADKGGNLKIYILNSKKTYIFEGVKVRDLTVSNDGVIFITDFNDFSIYKLSFLKKRKKDDNNINSVNHGEIYTSSLNVENEDEIDYENYKWTKIGGKAIGISAGPYSQPFIINREGLVMTSSKFGFN